MMQPESAEPIDRIVPEKSPETENEAPKTEENIDTLSEALTQAKNQAEENLTGWQRAKADLINYKRRSEQEKSEIVKFANSNLMLALLPVLDDFERAFNSMPVELEDAAWVEGVKLIEQKLISTLKAQGLSSIEAQGKPFDPKLHEAVMCCPGEENIVANEIIKGYKLHDKLLRPTAVAVGGGEDVEVAAENKED
jgi:molecular chaperone GrpE